MKIILAIFFLTLMMFIIILLGLGLRFYFTMPKAFLLLDHISCSIILKFEERTMMDIF